MERIRSLLSSVMALALVSSVAVAAESQGVLLRGNIRNGSTRLVFEALSPPHYTMTSVGGIYTFQFSDPVTITADDKSIQGLPRVDAYKITSPRSVELHIADGQAVSDFVVANKVIVDIKGTAGKPSPANIEPSASDKISDKATENENKIINLVNEKKLPPNIVVSNPANPPVVAAESAPEKKESSAVPSPAAPPPSPVKISLTSTSEVPLAVYRRSGYLWVVEDKLESPLPPTVTGLDGQAFEKIPANGLSVFRIKCPDTTPLYATGGGLAWGLTSDPETGKRSKPLDVESRFGEDTKTGPRLFWGAKTLHRIAEFHDPYAGDVVRVAFVNGAADFAGPARNYPEVDILPSPVGMAFVPKVDDIVATKTDDGMAISRPDGLALSPQKDILSQKSDEKQPENKGPDSAGTTTLFAFDKWRIGTINTISDNQRLIMSGLADLTENKKAENLINLGHMMLSFGYAPESIGYFDFAQQVLPDLENSPEFVAAQAAAQALSGQSHEAFEKFSLPQLNGIDEIKYWKAFTLADLEDWKQAAQILPDKMDILDTYPDEIRNPLGLSFAEIALRDGNPDKARKILDKLEPSKSRMSLGDASAFAYLSGEYSRQKGKIDDAKAAWKDLITGKDDLYRAKARFALSTLQYETKDITIDKAIDNLEGLRYAWRGDGLETSINYNLAKLYLKKGDPIKALAMMKLAQSLIPKSDLSKKINDDLHETFKNLFSAENIKSLNPIDAMTVYNEFSDLIPPGPEGEALSRQLAERLVDADLLPRAEKLLVAQVNGDLKGTEGADIAVRLASLQVLDGKASDALASLQKADAFLQGLPNEAAQPRQHDINMLRAKSLSMMGKTQEAFDTLSSLPQDETVLKMRADIAWTAKRWQDAADSLEQLLAKQNISLTRPLTDEQAATILNWAVALYQADNRYVLANLRERYSDPMAQTPFAKKFEVITRPRQTALLTDRDTINSIIGETTIFKDFLTTFKADPSKPVAIPPPETGHNTDEGPSPATNVPADLKNSPLVKTDNFRGD